MSYHGAVQTFPKPKHTSTIPSLDPALKRGGRLKFEKRVTYLALAAGFPAVLLSAVLLWYDGYSGRVQWTVDLFLVIIWLGCSFNLKQRIVRPLQTLSNILAAIREGDYSIRGRRAKVSKPISIFVPPIRWPSPPQRKMGNLLTNTSAIRPNPCHTPRNPRPVTRAHIQWKTSASSPHEPTF